MADILADLSKRPKAAYIFAYFNILIDISTDLSKLMKMANTYAYFSKRSKTAYILAYFKILTI